MVDAQVCPLAKELGIDNGLATNDVRGRPIGFLEESSASPSPVTPAALAAVPAASLIKVGASVLAARAPAAAE